MRFQINKTGHNALAQPNPTGAIKGMPDELIRTEEDLLQQFFARRGKLSGMNVVFEKHRNPVAFQ